MQRPRDNYDTGFEIINNISPTTGLREWEGPFKRGDAPLYIITSLRAFEKVEYCDAGRNPDRSVGTGWLKHL
jgi:hypothetical protein